MTLTRCQEVAHLLKDWKRLEDMRVKGKCDLFDYYRSMQNIQDRLDALILMKCPKED